MLKNNSTLVLIHLLLGFLLTLPFVSKIVVAFVLLYATYDIYMHKNKNEEAFLWSGYFVSMEVLLRMTGGAISWELVKYVILVFLGLGLFVEKTKRGVPVLFLLYLMLLCIGVVFSEIPAEESLRKVIVFNLSGPIVLGISAIYFYKRFISFKILKHFFFISLLPILSMLTLLYFKTPTLKELTFGTNASFAASGGFGPNQVATALGYGIFLLSTLLIVKKKVTGFILLDLILLFYLIFRGLLTFSRGGIITGFIAFVTLAVAYSYSQKRVTVFLKYFGITFVLLSAIWVYSTDLTGGMLENRYLGKNAKGEQKEDASSGRIDIFANQFESFMKNPFLGIGVGSGKYKRLEEGGHVTAASHNEVSRLLEEHGLIGVLSLILLVVAFFSNFKKTPMYGKGFILSFAILWFLTINHSAMRIAFPGFIYGLSLITIYKEEDELTAVS